LLAFTFVDDTGNETGMDDSEQIMTQKLTSYFRILMVHEKMDQTQYPILCPQFRPTQNPIRLSLPGHSCGVLNIPYNNTQHTCKRHLVYDLFAKYMLQIGYL